MRQGMDKMARLNCWVLLVLTLAGLLSAKALGQGETTSAIVGEVTDATSAVVPGARVTITNHETGLKRNAKTDGEGRFSFPQLKPGTYSVKAEAQGFAPRRMTTLSQDWARNKRWISPWRCPAPVKRSE